MDKKVLSQGELSLFTNLENKFKKRMIEREQKWIEEKEFELYNVYSKFFRDIPFDDFLHASYISSCPIRESWYYSVTKK